MTYRLFAHADTLGALTLYSHQSGAFGVGTEAAEVGLVPAAFAAAALAGSRDVDNLKAALTTRETISVAIGILMARQRIGRQEAFDVLRRASQRTNVNLRQIAEQIAGNDLDVRAMAEDLALIDD